jgi:hypothetical protein
MKRSLFLSLAAGLLTSLTLVGPSHAGSTLVTTSTSFDITAPAGTTVTDLVISYTPVDAITNLTVVSSTGLGTPTLVADSPGANQVEVDFGATSSGSIVFTFQTSASPGSVASLFLTPTFSGQSSNITGATTSLNVTAAAISTPEPSSVALLGIGITGFLAFRRLFKRPSVA